MGTIPTTTNQSAAQVDSSIKTAGEAIQTVVENLAIADFPFLGFPFVKQIFEAVLGFFTGYFEKAAQGGATFLVIDNQVSTEEIGMSKALAAVVAAEKTQDAAQIKAAIQAYANANSALIHDDGSAPAQ